MTENYNLPHPAVRHPTSPHSSRTSTCGGGRGHVALVARRSVLDPSLTLLISGSSLSNSGFLIYTVQALQYFALTNLVANELTVSLPFPLASRFRSDGRRRGIRIRWGTHEEAAEQRGEAAEAGGRPCRGAAGQRLPSAAVGDIQERPEESAVDFGRERHRPRRGQP